MSDGIEFSTLMNGGHMSIYTWSNTDILNQHRVIEDSPREQNVIGNYFSLGIWICFSICEEMLELFLSVIVEIGYLEREYRTNLNFRDDCYAKIVEKVQLL